MSQSHQNHVKKEEADNPNRTRTVYLWNIIFLSCLTIAALLFAMLVYFRLRTRGTDGFRKLYTEDQIRQIRKEESTRQSEILQARIRTSLESGLSATQVMRELFEDEIVVENGGSYSFFPVSEKIDKNPLPTELLVCRDGEHAEYLGTYPVLELVSGALLSDDNGRIDWDRLAGSGIREAAIRAGTIRLSGFEPDREAERNCREAAARGIPVMLCLQMEEPAGDEVLEEAAKAVSDLAGPGLPGEEDDLSSGEDTEAGEEDAEAGEQADGVDRAAGGEAAEADEPAAEPVKGLIRIRDMADLSEDGGVRAAWTDRVGALCGLLEMDRVRPVIGGSIRALAAGIDLSRLSRYERWLSDHEETVIFPYSFSCWEYSGRGHLEGVPGESCLYTRILYKEELSVEEK